MKSTEIIEKFGLLKKTELIGSIDDKILPGTLVFDALEPFPGYYRDNIPERITPDYVFLMTKRIYRNEAIVRTTQKIKKYFNKPFEAHYGLLTMFNEDQPCIRLKHLESYNYLAEIQQCYIDEGIKFRSYRKLEINSIFEFHKFFELKELADGIYADMQENAISYIKIPVYLFWKQFEEVTKMVKNNISNNNFDAALASFYSKTGLEEYIRIYCHCISVETLKNIQEIYIQSISKCIL